MKDYKTRDFNAYLKEKQIRLEQSGAIERERIKNSTNMLILRERVEMIKRLAITLSDEKKVAKLLSYTRDIITMLDDLDI